MTAQPKFDADDVQREICRRSLSAFVQRAWPVLEPGNPYVHGWHMDAMAAHLEAVASGEITRLLINVPPGMSKSTYVSVMFPAWLWGPARLPAKRILSASHEMGLSTRDSLRMRRLVESEWYQSLWPVRFASDQAQKTYYENTETGFRQASAFASLTGRRADLVVLDDPHSAESATSDIQRETTLRIFRETLPTRLNNPAESAIVVIMQRLHENDVSGEILSHDYGYESLILPMEFDPARRATTSIGFTDPRVEDGELLFPARFPREVVERDKIALGDYAYAGQFQQSPSPREGGDFKPGNIEMVDALPAGLRFTRGWDLAATKKKHSDYTAAAKMAESDGIVYIAHADHFKGSPDEVSAAIRQYAQTDKNTFTTLPDDPGQAGTWQAQAISKQLRGQRFEFTPESGDKITRAQPFAAQVNVGNVRMLRGDWNQDLIAELRSFPMGAHDDMVDACSRAYNTMVNRGTYNLRALA